MPPLRFMRREHLHSLSSTVGAAQCNGEVDGIFHGIGRQPCRGAKACNSGIQPTSFQGDVAGRIMQFGPRRGQRNGLRDQPQGFGTVTRLLGLKRALAQVVRRRRCHLSRNQPVIASRPAGAKGGT